MRSQFIKRLEMEQRDYLAIKGLEGKGHYFYYRGFDIPIIGLDESKYFMMRKDENWKSILREKGELLGLSLHFSDRYIALKVFLGGHGFWCHTKYLGKLRLAVTQQLQWCLGKDIRLDIRQQLVSMDEERYFDDVL